MSRLFSKIPGCSSSALPSAVAMLGHVVGHHDDQDGDTDSPVLCLYVYHLGDPLEHIQILQ